MALIAVTVQAQDADSFFHRGANSYINSQLNQAIKIVDEGLFQYPNDAKLNALKQKLEEVQTEYQHIEMWETDTFGYLMTIDGATMLPPRDNFLYHEMIAHPALFTHQDPKRVVIIGGGDCGTLKEVLRHPGVEKVTQIDIDEEVTKAAERFFPSLVETNGDPRAELLFADGVKWVDDAADESIDVLIIDSTDPVGPAEGLFKPDFLKRGHRRAACRRPGSKNRRLVMEV